MYLKSLMYLFIFIWENWNKKIKKMKGCVSVKFCFYNVYVKLWLLNFCEGI